MPFSTVVGHDWAVQVLRRALHQGSVGTGYLLVGPPHVGKTTLALAFAQAANCERPLSPNDPDRLDACGDCPTCARIADGHYVDVQVFHPRRRIAAKGEEGSDSFAEAQEGLYCFNDIREFVRSVIPVALAARRRVAVFASAERMDRNAYSALLKTLEEPPPATTLLLTTSRPGRVHPTIVSRCQKLHLHPLPRAELVAALAQARPDLSPERGEAVAALAVGAYGRALSLLDNELILALRGELLDVAAPLPAAELWEALRLAEVLLDLAERWWLAEAPEKDGARALKRNRDLILRSVLRGMLETLAGWFRDVVAIHGEHPLLNEDRRGDLKRSGQVYSPAAAVSACQVLEEIRGDLEQSVNPRLAMEALLIRLLQLPTTGLGVTQAAVPRSAAGHLGDAGRRYEATVAQAASTR